MSSSENRCPDCGAPIPAAAPAGTCPRCVFGGALSSDEFEGEATLPVDTENPPVRGEPSKAPEPSKASQFALTPDELDRFFPELEIESLLGAGGMGAVYKARQTRLDRVVALKVLTCPPEMHAEFALRFEREAQLLAKLDHPNIVTIHDFGEVDRSDDPKSSGNLFYFVMEYVDGSDLNGLIRTGKLTPEQALRLVPQICDALQFAHDQGITHRDIKPANILVDKRGAVRIADFGLAKLIEADDDALMSGLTLTGTSMGTPHYMAPEQWETSAVVDHRADIYSLGVVLYEMLTGERPHGRFDPPSAKTDVDDRIDEVVYKAMETNVERRYQQASEIKEEVTRVVSAEAAPRPKVRRSGGAGWWIAVAACMALLAGGAWWWTDWESEFPAIWIDGAEEPEAITTETEFPPGQWTKVLTSREKLDKALQGRAGVMEWEDGWVDASEGKGRLSLQFPDFAARNMGARLRGKISDRESLWLGVQIQLRTPDAPEDALVYSFGLEEMNASTPPRLKVRVQNPDIPTRGDLHSRFLPGKLKAGEEFEMAFFAIGNRLVARFNEEYLPIATDYTLRQGSVTIMNAHLIRDVELVNLDGVTEAEALEIAGAAEMVDDIAAAKDHGRPGRLRALGLDQKGDPIDVSAAKGVADIVEIRAIREREWFALRADGSTIRSDGETQPPLAGRRIFGSSALEPAFTDEDGQLVVPTRLTYSVPSFAGSVVDAALHKTHGLVLLEDGTVVPLGSCAGEGEAPWQPAPAGALEDIRSIHLNYKHAAVVTREGRVIAWTTDGITDLPGELDSGVASLTLIDISGSCSGHVVMDDGTTRWWNEQRPKAYRHDEFKSESQRFVSVVGLRRIPVFHSGSGEWVLRKEAATVHPELAAQLGHLTNVSPTRWAGHAFGSDDDYPACLFWIEPGAPATTGEVGQDTRNERPPGIPGRLRALGTQPDGSAPDLSKVEPFDDIVQVGGHAGNWVALRANGDTVSLKGDCDFSGIERLCPSFNQLFALIDWNGKIRFPDSADWSLAPDFEEEVFIDVQLGSKHGIALTKDGRAKVFGQRYEETVGDLKSEGWWNEYATARWPQPPARPLSNIVDIAVTSTHAATLSKNGTLSVFGWEGEVEFDRNGQEAEIVDIESEEDELMILDGLGKIWTLPLPRNSSPDQPIGMAGSFYPIESASSAVVKLSGRCWLTAEGDWNCQKPAGLREVLAQAEVDERSVPVTDSGILDGNLYYSLLWIEPGPEAAPLAIDHLAEPGRLVATGTYQDGSSIDLSQAEGIDDFVQVYLFGGKAESAGWIGLRQNGETVTSGDEKGHTGVVEIHPGISEGYVLEHEDGTWTTILSDDAPNLAKQLPPLPEDSTFEEILVATYNSIARTKSGQAIAWGARYGDPSLLPEWMDDRTTWEKPGPEAFRDVVSIGAGNGWAGTVTEDGKLHVWTSGGILDLGEYSYLQGRFTGLSTAMSSMGEAVLRDGRILNFNLTTGKLRLIDWTGDRRPVDHVSANHRALYQRQDGSWTCTFPDESFQPLLDEVAGRSKDAFSMHINIPYHDEGEPEIRSGLIEIVPTDEEIPPSDQNGR